jgi:hypothetical protein
MRGRKSIGVRTMLAGLMRFFHSLFPRTVLGSTRRARTPPTLSCDSMRRWRAPIAPQLLSDLHTKSTHGNASGVAWVTLPLTLCLASATWADDAPSAQFTLGAKIWDTQWTSWDPVPSRSLETTGPVTVIQPVSSNNHVEVIPQASVRYGNWLGSASYLVNTTYFLTGAIDPESGNSLSVSALRKEFDANLGYYILPSVAITVGYKQITQIFGQGSRFPEPFKWTGPTIGMAGSAVIRPHLSMYGAVGVGFFRLRIDEQLQDAAGDVRFDANYALAELGLAYSVPTPISRMSFTVTLGYRVQIVTTKNYALSSGFSNGRTYVDVHDTTQGPVLSMVGRY